MVSGEEAKHVSVFLREALRTLQAAWTALPRLQSLAHQLAAVLPLLEDAHHRYLEVNHRLADIADDPIVQRVHETNMEILPILAGLREYVMEMESKWAARSEASKLRQFVARIGLGIQEVAKEKFLRSFGKRSIADHQKTLNVIIQRFRDLLAAETAAQTANLRQQLSSAHFSVAQSQSQLALELTALKQQMQRLESPIRHEWKGKAEDQIRYLKDLDDFRTSMGELAALTSKSAERFRSDFSAQRKQMADFMSELKDASDYGEGIDPTIIPSIDETVQYISRQMSALLNSHEIPLPPQKSVHEKLEKLRRKTLAEFEDCASLTLYVPALVCRRAQLLPEHSTGPPHVDAVHQILSSMVETPGEKPEDSFLLLGESGTGKTTVLQRVTTALWERWEAADGAMDAYVPIFMRLPMLCNPKSRLIEETFERCGFEPSDIDELRESRRILFLFDAYDELQLRINFFVTANLRRWKRAKFCIACRTEYADMMGVYTDWLSCVSGGVCDEWHIAPFNRSQIEQYVASFVRWNANPPLPSAASYVEAFQRVSGVWEMCQNPFLLSVLCEVLPDVVSSELEGAATLEMVESGVNVNSSTNAYNGSGSSGGTTRTSRYKRRGRFLRRRIYDAFVAKWLERSLVRFLKSDGNDDNDEILDFRGECKALCFALARSLHESRSTIISLSSTDPPANVWKAAKPAIRNACPLRKIGRDTYEFLHKSLQDHFVAEDVVAFALQRPQLLLSNNAVGSPNFQFGNSYNLDNAPRNSDNFDEFGGTDQPDGSRSGWDIRSHHIGRLLLSSFPQILRILGDRAVENGDFQAELWGWISASSGHSSERDVASANALSVLNWGGISLAHRDLRGICARQANLSKARLQWSNARGADFRGSLMDDAVLDYALLEGARMDRVRWLTSPPFAGHSGIVLCVAVAPNSRFIATGSADKSVRVWDLNTGESLRVLEGHTNWVRSVSISPDARYIVSGSSDHTVRVWDAATGDAVRTLTGHTHLVQCVAVSPDMRYIVSGSSDHSIRVWDFGTGECLRTLIGHKNWVRCVTFSPDAQYIISGSSDNSVRVWNVETGNAVRTLLGHTEWVRSVSISPDSRWIVSGSSDTAIRVWDLRTGESVRTLEGHTASVSVVRVAPDGSHIISGSSDKTLRIWNLHTGECVRTLTGHPVAVESLAVTHDGTRVISGARDAFVRVWDLYSAECLRPVSGHTSSVLCVAFLGPRGSCIVSGGEDAFVRLWETETGECLRVFGGHSTAVRCVTVSPDSSCIVSGSADKSVRVWDVETGECLRTLVGHTHWVHCVSVTTDASYILSGAEDVRLWNFETGECLRTFLGHSDLVLGVAVAPNSRFFATGSADKSVRVWDLQSGECLRVLNGHTNWVRSVSISPDARYIVSGSSDHTVRVWDATTGDAVRTLAGHTKPITAVSTAENGGLIISSCEDASIRVWDAETGTCWNILRGHSNAVNGVVTTEDGTQIASCSADKSIRLWHRNRAGEIADTYRLEGAETGIATSGELNAMNFNTSQATNSATSETYRLTHVMGHSPLSAFGCRVSSGEAAKKAADLLGFHGAISVLDAEPSKENQLQ